MRVMILGDTHGIWMPMQKKLNRAGKLGIKTVLVVGDFGLWTHQHEGQMFLDNVQKCAEKNNLSVYAIGGNHENWDHWNWYIENNPKAAGWAFIRSRILIAPRVHAWRWGDQLWVGAGGGVSVDRDWRLQYEAKHHGPKTAYWPNEQLLDSDVQTIKDWGVRPTYLITHDCSNYTPFQERLKNDIDSHIHRQRIDEVLRATRPEMHFHGHMHEKYDWLNGTTYGHEHFTQTYGLENDDKWYSYGILDTKEKSWTWRDEG